MPNSHERFQNGQSCITACQSVEILPNLVTLQRKQKKTSSSHENNASRAKCDLNRVVFHRSSPSRKARLFFLKNVPSPASFCLFLSYLQTNNTVFITNQCEKMLKKFLIDLTCFVGVSQRCHLDPTKLCYNFPLLIIWK